MARKGASLPGAKKDNQTDAKDLEPGTHTSPNPADPPGSTIVDNNPNAQKKPAADLNLMSPGYGNQTLKSTGEDAALDANEDAFKPIGDDEDGVLYFNAIRDTMYDSDHKLYFFTNKATRVEGPFSGWLKAQVAARLIGRCDKNFSMQDEAPAPESFNSGK